MPLAISLDRSLLIYLLNSIHFNSTHFNSVSGHITSDPITSDQITSSWIRLESDLSSLGDSKVSDKDPCGKKVFQGSNPSLIQLPPL